MSLLAIFKGKGPSGFGYGSTAEDVTKGLDPIICNVGKSSRLGRDEEMAAKLWEVSENIVAEVTAPPASASPMLGRSHEERP